MPARMSDMPVRYSIDEESCASQTRRRNATGFDDVLEADLASIHL